ncbi:SRPBCC family protein [Cognatilysobacter terrigena]|uniref:SRPBCC family protein n=1 Tax=Cognatilysobacter terrigena TaxID=2488749 RepID=UPI00105CEECE|nr:SRPBCC family protein [Lysobacter terrigena]
MTRLLEILISIAIVFALFVIVGIFLPSSRHLSESVQSNRKIAIAYDLLNNTRRFTDWNPILLHDPAANVQTSGKDEGVGAKVSYQSKVRGVGNGSWEITEAEPNKRVVYAITTDSPGSNKRSEFTLQPVGNRGRNTQITQTYDVNYGFNPIARYAGLYVSNSVGEDIKLGLGRLTNALAGVPNIDYSQLPVEYKSPLPTLGQRPAETLLTVGAVVPIDRDKIKGQMNSNLEWIKKVIASNGLEQAGPVRIITNEQGSANYSFDVAVPVKKAGAGEKIEGISTSGTPVKVAYNDAAKVVGTTFKGDMGNLQRLRDAIRAWSLTHGYATLDRPYEIWNGGIDAGFSDQGEFTVQWAVK